MIFFHKIWDFQEKSGQIFGQVEFFEEKKPYIEILNSIWLTKTIREIKILVRGGIIWGFWPLGWDIWPKLSR